MKHRIISLVTVASFLTFITPSRADVAPDMEEVVQPAAEPLSPALVAEALEGDTTQDSSEPKGKEVGKAATDGSNSAKRKQWQNIGLAIGAVAVAVTALILVSNNQGHETHSDD